MTTNTNINDNNNNNNINDDNNSINDDSCYLVFCQVRFQTSRFLIEEQAVESGSRSLSMVPHTRLTEKPPLHVTHIATPSTANHLQQEQIITDYCSPYSICSGAASL